MDSRAYWVWLQRGIGQGSSKVRRITEDYLSVEQFYEAGRSDWRMMGIFTAKELERLSEYTLEEAADLIAVHETAGIQVITPDDVRYPDKLREIYNFPAVLYVKGQIPDFSEKLSIAMVGTRRGTKSGLVAARTIARDLAKRDVIVVSGGALGIDTAVHTGVLDSDGETLCILGCGIGYHYLPESMPMRRAITRRGALVSEFPKGTPPLKQNFPLRNRIISGLCDGTLVVEAGVTSGSLITAREAREQNRDVFAVPGNITQSTAEGTNDLIKNGAKMVTSAGDVLEEYYGKYPYLNPRHSVSFPGFSAKKEAAAPVKSVEKHSEQKQAVQTEQPEKKKLTQEELYQMIRDKNWNFDLNDLPSEAELIGTRPAPVQESKQEPEPEIVWKVTPVVLPMVEKFSQSAPNPKPAQPKKQAAKPAQPAFAGSEQAKLVLQVLTKEQQHISELCEKTGLDASQVMCAVTELEMDDLVKTYAGAHFGLA